MEKNGGQQGWIEHGIQWQTYRADFKAKAGKFHYIFGKAARNNPLRARMIKQLKETRSQRKKFEVYGSKAQGQSQADHALSICAGKDGNVMYNANVSILNFFSTFKKALSYMTLPYSPAQMLSA